MSIITKLKQIYEQAKWGAVTAENTRTLLDIFIMKATPEKPSKVTNKNDEFVKYVCPVCGGFLIKNYPCKCGKMIDWSDENV